MRRSTSMLTTHSSHHNFKLSRKMILEKPFFLPCREHAACRASCGTPCCVRAFLVFSYQAMTLYALLASPIDSCQIREAIISIPVGYNILYCLKKAAVRIKSQNSAAKEHFPPINLENRDEVYIIEITKKVD